MTRLYLFLVLLIVCQLSRAQSPETVPIDQEFLVLMQWAQDLNEKAISWNDHCDGDPKSEGCELVRKTLNAQLIKFIDEASRYHSTEEDCRGTLRGQCIQHEIRAFTWNLQNVGNALSVEAVVELTKIKTEEDALMEAIHDYADPKTRL